MTDDKLFIADFFLFLFTRPQQRCICFCCWWYFTNSQFQLIAPLHKKRISWSKFWQLQQHFELKTAQMSAVMFGAREKFSSLTNHHSPR
jgi:hypothetical protein